MASYPSGDNSFFLSLLCFVAAYHTSNWVFPKPSPTGIAFKDLKWNHARDQVIIIATTSTCLILLSVLIIITGILWTRAHINLHVISSCSQRWLRSHESSPLLLQRWYHYQAKVNSKNIDRSLYCWTQVWYLYVIGVNVLSRHVRISVFNKNDVSTLFSCVEVNVKVVVGSPLIQCLWYPPGGYANNLVLISM